MKKSVLFLTCVFGISKIFAEPTGNKKPTEDKNAKIILNKAEEIRSVNFSELGVYLTTIIPKGTKENLKDKNKTLSAKLETVYDLKILRGDKHKAFLDFLGPAEEIGRKMLVIKRAYLSTFPDSNKVIPISRRELIGNSAFAIADVLQIDADEDYYANFNAKENQKDPKFFYLDLTAKHDDAPYAGIQYKIEKDTFFPVEAKFFSFTGKHFKTMTIETRKELAGRLRPEILKMVDEITLGKISYWKNNSVEKKNIPDNVFTKEFLQK